MMGPGDLRAVLEQMQRDWDARARENPRFYVDTRKRDWPDGEFFQSGEQTAAEEILTDLPNICRGKDPKRMHVLEIGCGAGRVTRVLARLFGQVYAVDISGEMVRQARAALADLENVHIYQNSGKDLDVLGNQRFDFAFSSLVFQHIPSHAVIESYVRAVRRRLRRECLFKFQVQGEYHDPPIDTWVGVPLSLRDAEEMAIRCDFEMRGSYGAGTQYFWIWYVSSRIMSRLWWQHRRYKLHLARRRLRRAIGLS
jgi:SAM-dependent methyltransferase